MIPPGFFFPPWVQVLVSRKEMHVKFSKFGKMALRFWLNALIFIQAIER